MNLDSIDIQILSRLKQNARMKASQISDEVGLSISSVTERIHKLEKNGVITSYTVLVDQKAIGNDTIALMEVSLEHPKYYDSFAEMIAQTKNIASCYYISGDFDFMLKIVAPSENLEEILAAADGLMVARGDMGVELPPEQVPYIQKKMIDMANAAGKITICATQMLESMTHNPRPTRAEVGDVANAVYDGATAVMLSASAVV